MAIGDIGIWYDAAGTQTWTTSFVLFPFNTEYRNDGTYKVSGSGKGFQLTEDGNYLCLTYIHGEGGNNRENLQIRTLLDDTEVQGSRGAGYQRDNNNNQIYCRASCMLLNALSGQIVTVQARRDSDNITNTAVANYSEIMLIHLPDSSQAAFGHYGSTYIIDNFDGTDWKNGLWEDKKVETDTSKISGGTGGIGDIGNFCVLGHCGEDGGDGYLPTLYGATPTINATLSLAADEADWDSERNHTTEDMSYWALENIAGNIKNSVGTIIGEYSSQSSIDGDWTTVNLSNTYTYPIIVCTHNLMSGDDPPATVRISGTTTTSFKVRMDAGGGHSEVSSKIYWMAMESGNHTLPGGDECEASFQPDNSDLGFGAWTSISEKGSYTNIAVLTQIAETPEDKFLQAWCCNGSTKDGTPTPGNIALGRHYSEDPDTTRMDTDINYIIVERGTGTIGEVNWDAGITNDDIAGVDDSPPYTYSLTGFGAQTTLFPGNKITLNPSGTRFLILYSFAHNLGAGDVRTQRISRCAISSATKYEGIPQSYGYTYIRDDENQYGETNAWFIHKTTEDDEILLVQCQRGNADVDSSGDGFASSQSAVFIMELPSYAETFISHDSTGDEAVGDTTTYLKWMRDVDQNDSSAFTQASISSMNVEKDCDVLLLANGLLERQTESNGTRLTTAARFFINGVEQTRGQHGCYLRGEQSSYDTFNGSLNPAGIWGISSNNKVCVQQFDDGQGGSGDDETQSNQCGFCALNIDSLIYVPPVGGYTSFATPIGTYDNWSWAPSAQFNVDNGMRATDQTGTNFEWGIISSSTNYYYPSGDYEKWTWISGSAS